MVKYKSNPKPVQCPNNEGVACMYPNRCENCGWNLAVAKIRTANIKK